MKKVRFQSDDAGDVGHVVGASEAAVLVLGERPDQSGAAAVAQAARVHQAACPLTDFTGVNF